MTGGVGKCVEVGEGEFCEGEQGVGSKVAVVSTLVDEADLRDLEPILGSKLSGRLDLGP